ncbi:MAG: PAS domain-containing sensor histidine kinase [Betaproteobacteria bacterium]|jgi:PAS domain S-box-containing protein|nr:PAS domain-containing sensor histidine kinase [Betaproteobacteria bacterium]NBP44173.1 PAS domain-containing sensor histidine kinase [Betaproteobacteria bacterium]
MTQPHRNALWEATKNKVATWWRRQTPSRQDRYAVLAPLVAVVLFLITMMASLTYFRLEEVDRERESVRRDLEYAQQRIRLRVSEREERVLQTARQLGSKQISRQDFLEDAESMVVAFPEVVATTWVNAAGQVVTSYASASQPLALLMKTGERLNNAELRNTFNLVKDLKQPVFSAPLQRLNGSNDLNVLIYLMVPVLDRSQFMGAILVAYNIEGLLRYAVPPEINARLAMSIVDSHGKLLAGLQSGQRSRLLSWLPFDQSDNDYRIPIAPVGNSLWLNAQPYRTTDAVIGNGLLWLVAVLSAMTTWLLYASWRHTRRRLKAQRDLVAETNFRRAMENSMLTGMRAMDLNGRITYVNAAFCQMTGWSEEELVGATPPFAYWPPEDYEQLWARMADELQGRSLAGGTQMRVQRKDGTQFDARMYFSPLIDARGEQTGWMTSMTDITEPNKIRDQLAASHARFTTVLEALDASVSVAPLGSTDLLFSNKLFRQWFGNRSESHLELVKQAGSIRSEHSGSGDDDLAGFPTSGLTETSAENAEIYMPELKKWLEVRSRYLNWVDGSLAQMVIATDITPRRLAEQQAESQAEKAQSASRLITMGEMASSVAHELNQPLTAISNYCTGMVSRIKAKQVQAEDLIPALEKTAHQAQRAGQVIHRIRSFVQRSESNRQFTPVAVMIAEMLELADIELRRRMVRIHQDIQFGLPDLLVDRILIEQVLINLLKNAAESIDAANRQALDRRVQLKVQLIQNEGTPVVQFSVTDTGRGLSDEVMDRVFEAFFTTKREGMGIGLNLCRTIIEAHQGRMKAENLYNGSEITGCCFSFWLPVVSGPAAPASQPSKSAPIMES